MMKGKYTSVCLPLITVERKFIYFYDYTIITRT